VRRDKRRVLDSSEFRVSVAASATGLDPTRVQYCLGPRESVLVTGRAELTASLATYARDADTGRAELTASFATCARDADTGRAELTASFATYARDADALGVRAYASRTSVA
jgi:hypothetical protein